MILVLLSTVNIKSNWLYGIGLNPLAIPLAGVIQFFPIIATELSLPTFIILLSRFAVSWLIWVCGLIVFVSTIGYSISSKTDSIAVPIILITVGLFHFFGPLLPYLYVITVPILSYYCLSRKSS